MRAPYTPVCGGTVVAVGKSVPERLSAAHGAFRALLAGLPTLPDLIAMEQAAWGNSKAGAYNSRDEQQQMAGVIRLVCFEVAGLSDWERVPANSAKKALTGYGLAEKQAMGDFALAFISGADEHCADSCGIALAALERRGVMPPGEGFAYAHQIISGA